MLPLLYDVTGHIMCPVKLCYIIQHLRHMDNEKVGSFNVEPHHVCLFPDETFFHSFPPVTCYSSYVARGDILLLCAANSGQKGIAVLTEWVALITIKKIAPPENFFRSRHCPPHNRSSTIDNTWNKVLSLSPFLFLHRAKCVSSDH